MKEMPNAFWATLFILLSGGLAIAALIIPNKDAATMQVLTLASSIATGAFGYIQGHKDGVNAANPTQPGGPAQPK